MKRVLVMIAVGGACGEGPGPEVEDPVLGAVRFAFPIRERERINGLVGVDHDPAQAVSRVEELICYDYLRRPFPHCYDGHDGSDFLLEGGFEAMDAGSATVIAAAAGEVVAVEDGHYDRCHGTLEGVDCDGHDGVANSVILEHPGGLRSTYWHLMRDSTLVAVGDAVERGAALGMVGSSGHSSLPHLHFEAQVAEVTVDPYAGPESQSTSWWCDQGLPDDLPGDCEGQ